MKKEINGVEHDFAKVGDIWIGVKPVTRAQYYGWDADDGQSPVTKLTRAEVLAWCANNGCRLPNEEEWELAIRYGVISSHYQPGDAWDEVAGDERVLRGGCWINYMRPHRAYCRTRYGHGYRNSNVGFRVCLESHLGSD